jgi:hypothetical protein
MLIDTCKMAAVDLVALIPWSNVCSCACTWDSCDSMQAQLLHKHGDIMCGVAQFDCNPNSEKSSSFVVLVVIDV